MNGMVSPLGEYRNNSKTIIAGKPLRESTLFRNYPGLGQLYSLQANSSIQYAFFQLENEGLGFPRQKSTTSKSLDHQK